MALVSVTHLFFPSDGRRGPAVAAVLVRPPNSIQLSLLSPHLFPPPGEAYPFDVLISISIECSESPTSSRFSLLPTRRRGYPYGSVAWSHVKTSTQASGGLLCLPSTCDAHPFDAMSLDLPSDVVRASLSGIPNSFYLPADRTHSSDEGVLRPSRRLHGPSRPDTALCPPISGG